MDQHISPQEFHLLSDHFCIRTRCPYARITDEMVARQVKRGNLVTGDAVFVQCMSHDYTDLLAEAEYRVVSRKSELKTYEGESGNTRQVEEITFKVERWGDWRVVEHRPLEVLPAGEAPPAERYVSGEARAVWDAKRQGFDIMVADLKVGFSVGKETANRIAAGELPLPEAA